MTAKTAPWPFHTAVWMTVCIAFTGLIQAAPPDLTQPGVIATIDHSKSYNLGPTGLRGWVYLSSGFGGTYGTDGTMTDESRQILITVASSPATNGDLQVDDVILGVTWGAATDPGTIPNFTSDARKAFGNAITQAERAGNGVLWVNRYRASNSTTVRVPIALPIMGDYASTAPFSCPKSTAILNALRSKVVAQVIANPGMLSTATNADTFNTSTNALALLASVAPGDPDYATVQSLLQTYARGIAANSTYNAGLSIWSWSYCLIFLSEYYLSTGDTAVLPGINQFSLKMAQSQSMYGTFGHNPAMQRPDGTGRMSVIAYGPVNAVGVAANLSMVLGRKALQAGAQPVDPQIDAAIQRGADFFAWYVNKGSIPYGEHHPYADNHSSNGKDTTAALFYSILGNRPTETEYYTRMSVAGFVGREYGHTGQGLSYLWEGMGANVGGPLAAAEYYKKVRWHLDLSRRTDGSFVYDGAEQYGMGTTSDGSYLGTSAYHGLTANSIYLLAFSLPLKRLYITGKNADPAQQLDSTKVANAVAAATYKFDRTSRTIAQLITDLTEFDPVTRNFAAQELATRTLAAGDLTTLRAMLTGTNVNERMGACQALGLIKDSTAMSMITQRLDKTVEADSWVRATAAIALRNYGTTANSQVNSMLTAFAANASNPDTIVWSDPLQAANGELAWTLFGPAPGTNTFNFSSTVNAAAKNLLYPALAAGFKHPDSAARQSVAGFSFQYTPMVDVQALPNDFATLIRSETQCDRMWSGSGRRQGIRILSKYKFFETMPLGFETLYMAPNFGEPELTDQAISEIAIFGDSARWTLPTLRAALSANDPTSSTYTALANAINSIEGAITSPVITYLNAAANGQVVTTAANTAKAITLTGSSVRDPSVSFAILTQPSHGTLSGTPPNVTYTPVAGYTGPDQFTFKTTDTLTASTPATVGIVVGTAGNGLKGEYFDNANFSNLVLTRTDAQVNFDWGTGSPNVSVGADTFSVRWSGRLLVPETCACTFSTLTSDGVRLYVNGVLVIDNFMDQATRWVDSAPIQLTAGQMVSIQMEYYENTGSAVAKLKWTGPGVAGITGEIIPQAYLFNSNGSTPYALAQNVSMSKNTSQDVTLTGAGDNLTFTVLSQPSNGSLTGTPPYLTYTPIANYAGTDSFTFLVNNGSRNSSPATVSIAILGAPSDTYTWSSPATGNMSLGSNWVSSMAPAAAGSSTANLSFSPTGTYTVTHDLNDGFALNQLNFAGAVTIAGTNSLGLTANGAALPQINQNGANTVTINTPLVFNSTTRLGGSFGGKMTLNGALSGGGGLVKNSPGTLLVNNLNNTYTGGTTINAGIASTANGNGSTTPVFGTGPVTVNNATLDLERIVMSNPMTLNDATITAGNSFATILSGPLTIQGTLTIDMGNTGGLQISGNISGVGGLKSEGTNQWSLSGTNSYTGPTTIQAGTIRYTAAASVAPGALVIASGGKANLNYSGNSTVGSLTLNGVTMPAGTYGGSASSAANKNDTYFTSTSLGTVTVLPSTSTTLALTGGSSPANVGTPLTFTATVSGNSPTGSVSFYAGSTLLGATPLDGTFKASLATSSLAVGSYNITARYVGNASNATSTSGPLAISIVSALPSAPTNVVATAGSNKVNLAWNSSRGADGYYVKRSQSSGGPYPVIGYSNSTAYLDSTAVNGTTYYYVLSAYNGSGEGANSSQVSATPALQGSATTLASTPGTTVYGASVTFTATVAGSSGTPTGTVTFKDGATTLGSSSLSAGRATLTTGALTAGSHSIIATYGGDPTYATSVSATYAYVVTPKPVTITGVSAANKVYDGNAAATLSGGTLSGVINGDAVTIVQGTGSFSDSRVGTWPVAASGYALAGAKASNYSLSAQPVVPNASITARPVQVTGTRVYNGTTAATSSILTISNNVDGAGLYLTGSASLSAKDVGTRTIANVYATPVRVQKAVGNTGANASTTINVNLTSIPANGNTLVAVISTRGASTGQVSAIAGGGVTWTRVAQVAGGTSTTEIWYGSAVSNGTTAITITQASLCSAAVVMEYSGLLAPNSFDVAAGSAGTGVAASTGTTANTGQSSELWIGGIGIASSSATLGSLTNSFVAVDNTASINTTAANNARVYALERMVTAAGTASTGGTLSASVSWSGTIATFKAMPSLTLAGSAAGNYTLLGMTSTVSITAKALAVSGLAAANRAYNGTTSVTFSGTPSLATAEAPGSGSASDGKPYTGDTVTLSGTATGTFATKHVGTNKPVTLSSSFSLTGAQAANYTLAALPALTANVTQLPITVSAVSATKAYDGTTASAGTPTISPALATGDTTSGLSQIYDTPNAGTGKTLSPAITINDGNSGANYVTTLVNSTAGTITQAAQTITFGPLASVLNTAPPFDLTATASSGLAVTYTSSNPAVASVSGSTVTPLSEGTTTITASQAGNGNYSTATPVQQTLTVTATPPVADAGGTYKVRYGQSLSLNGSASQASSRATITAYQWDLNNDNIFGDVSGATPAPISRSTLVSSWGMTIGLNTIKLKITDSANKTAIVSTTVELVPVFTWDANGTGASQTDGSGTWTAAGQWWSGSSNVDWTSGSDTSFGNGGVGGAVSLPVATTVETLTMNAFSGTYTLGTAGNAITVNNGLTVNAGAGATTFVSPVTVANSQTWSLGSSNLVSMGTINASATTITKTGTGTLVVTANNSSTVPNTSTWDVQAGALSWGNASGLGAAIINLNGGNLDATSNQAGQTAFNNVQNWNANWRWVGSASSFNLGTGAVTLGANGGNPVQVTVNANLVTVGGVIGDGGNARGVTKAGPGILVLSGSNTFSGVTNVNAGVLRLAHVTALKGGIGATGGASALAINGGVVEMAANDFLRNLGNTASTFGISGGVSGFSAYGGPRNVIINNSAATEVQWGNTYFAPSELVLNESTASGTLTFQNKLDLNGTTRIIDVNADTAVMSGVIRTSTGTAGLIKKGAGTLVLSALNTYNGPTTISGGILRVPTPANLPGYNTAGGVVFNGGTLVCPVGAMGWTTANVDSLLGAATKASGALGIDTSSGDLTQWTLFTGSLGISKFGANTLTLNLANTYTGATTIYGGTLRIQNATGLTQALGGGLAIAGPEVTLLSDYNGGSGTLRTTFGTVSRRVGASANISFTGGVVGSTNIINVAGSAGFVDAGVFLNGNSFAWRNAANGYLRAPVYGTDPNTVDNPTSPISAFTSTTHYRLPGSFTQSNTGTAATLKIDGASGGAFTQTTGALLTNAILKAGGGTYTFSGGAVRSVNGEIVVRTSDITDKVVIGAFDTAAKLTKSGAGTLTFTNSTTTLEDIFVNAGTLEFGTAGSISNANFPIFINTGATFLYNSSTTKTLSGTISGGGSVVKSGSSSLTLSGFNSFTGGLVVNAGTLIGGVANDWAFGVPGTHLITVNSGGTLALNRTNISGTLTMNGGTLTTGNSFGSTISGSVVLQSTSVFQGQNGTSITVNGVISGTGGLTKNNTTGFNGEVILAAANTFTGNTVLNGNTATGTSILTLAHSLALQNSVLDTTTSAAGTATAGLKTGLTALTLGGLSGNKDFSTMFTTTVGGYSGVTALTLNPRAGVTNTYSGAIADGAAGMVLNKTGAGIQILGGANTYTGATNINAGKVFVTGSLGNVSAPLTVANGATLGGTGTIGRNVTIAGGGKLEFAISTNAATHDRLDISAGRDFAFAGASELTITSAGGIAAGTYTLIAGGNNISGSAPGKVNMPAGWLGTVSISGNSLLLTVSAATGFAPASNSTFSSGTQAPKSPASDTDSDGLSDGIEWVVGGDPTLAGDAATLAPVLNATSDPTYFLFTYRRADAAFADPKTAISVEYSTDLTNWSAAVDDDSNIITVVNDDFFGLGIDKVTVKLKRTLAASGRIYVRLRVVISQ